MDTDAPNGQESDYGSSPWIELGAFESPGGSHHSPPLPDFHGFSYGSSPIMPLEPAYSMSIPPPYSTINLTMPVHPWPSMLTTQSPFPETSLSPAPTPTLSIPQPVPIRPLHTTPAPSAPTPRRTLTDEDRRRMCLYHEENKSAKQTDIGALFGVERSTVSKVLRQKEKYLSMDDGSRSPIKRSKGKVPDIEKALANWARNYQRQGFVLTDAMIKEKAHFFATTCASPDGKQKILTASWLEKFKQKNNLSGSKSRKNSTDTIASDGGEDLPHLQSPTGTLISTGVSPISPTGLTPSPLSPSMSQETLKKELGESALLDFSRDPVKHGHSQSTTSIDTTPSLSAGVASPTSPLISESPYTPTVRSRLPSISSAASRPRSQTFPLAGDAESLNGNGEHHNVTNSKHSMNGSLSVSVVDSPLYEDHEKKDLNDTGDDSNNSMKHRRSNSDLKSISTSMQPPPVPPSRSSTVSSPVSPGSPTQDEARRALELVMNYIQNQPSGLGLQMQDYVTMGKLMEKLDLVHNNQSISGRLHRIDEDADGPQMTKKRSIHSLT